jgi:hypothetical protein
MNNNECDGLVIKTNISTNDNDIDIKHKYEDIIFNLRMENKKLKNNIIAIQPNQYNKHQVDKKKDIIKGVISLYRVFSK